MALLTLSQHRSSNRHTYLRVLQQQIIFRALDSVHRDRCARECEIERAIGDKATSPRDQTQKPCLKWDLQRPTPGARATIRTCHRNAAKKTGHCVCKIRSMEWHDGPQQGGTSQLLFVKNNLWMCGFMFFVVQDQRWGCKGCESCEIKHNRTCQSPPICQCAHNNSAKWQHHKECGSISTPPKGALKKKEQRWIHDQIH